MLWQVHIAILVTLRECWWPRSSSFLSDHVSLLIPTPVSHLFKQPGILSTVLMFNVLGMFVSVEAQNPPQWRLKFRFHKVIIFQQQNISQECRQLRSKLFLTPGRFTRPLALAVTLTRNLLVRYPTTGRLSLHSYLNVSFNNIHSHVAHPKGDLILLWESW